MEVTAGGIYLYEPPTIDGSSQSAKLVASGSEQQGMRPFVIVSRDLVNCNRPTAVGVPLTSKIHKARAYRILLPRAELLPTFGEQFSFTDSVALCDQVRVIDISRIKTKIGAVSATAFAAIGLGLAYVFDFR